MNLRKLPSVWLGATALASLAAQESGAPLAEAGYSVDFLPVPGGEFLEVGGMGFLSDGSLVLGTRRGEVWIVENPGADDPRDARFHRFADGLFEALGVQVLPGDRIVVTQRTELSELIDSDGDGRCDTVETLCTDWGQTGNYHEFAFGANRRDAEGRTFVALNLGFFTPYWYLGVSRAPYRGWVVAVEPDGAMVPWASGFRSPNGVSMSPRKRLLVTDNQGDWVPACPIHVVERGRHYGHPASLRWREDWLAADRRPDRYEPDEITPRTPAAHWVPYDLSRSTGNLAWDTSGGRFGPFVGSAFAAELTEGRVFRVGYEQVEGVWQGWSTGFVDGTGAANRIAFGPDGVLYCGLTSRGWGGTGPAHGVSRIRCDGGTRGPVIRDVRIADDGFVVTFARPLDADLRAADVRASRYHYKYWWKYGSDETDAEPLRIESIQTAPGRLSVRIRFADFAAGHNVRVEFSGARSDGEPMTWPRFDYTVNILPGQSEPTPVARAVEPPETREQAAAYGVYLSDLPNTMRVWEGEGWGLGSDPRLDPTRPSRLMVGDGRHYLFCPAGAEQPVRTRFAFGSCTIRGEVMFAAGGAFDLLLPNGSAVEIRGVGVEPGTWVPLRVDYAVDAGGRGVLEKLELGGRDRIPKPRPLGTGEPRGPVGLRDLAGARAAFKNWVVIPRPRAGSELAAGPLDAVACEGAAVVVGAGERIRIDPAGGSATLADDLAPGQDRAFELRLAPRTAGVLDVGGVEVVLNRSAPGAAKTGSVVGGATLRESLVAYDDTRFVLGIRTAADGAVTVRVNGVVAAADHPAPADGLGSRIVLRRIPGGDGPLELFTIRQGAPR